jgi:hypothetical protein
MGVFTKFGQELGYFKSNDPPQGELLVKTNTMVTRHINFTSIPNNDASFLGTMGMRKPRTYRDKMIT